MDLRQAWSPGQSGTLTSYHLSAKMDQCILYLVTGWHVSRVSTTFRRVVGRWVEALACAPHTCPKPSFYPGISRETMKSHLPLGASCVITCSVKPSLEVSMSLTLKKLYIFNSGCW